MVEFVVRLGRRVHLPVFVVGLFEYSRHTSNHSSLVYKEHLLWPIYFALVSLKLFYSQELQM